MEKIHGVPLGDIWPRLPPDYKLKIMLQIFEYQQSWSAVCFSQFGNLYYARDVSIPPLEPLYTEHGVPVSNPEFVVGPAVGREWSDEGRKSLRSQRGPCKCFEFYPILFMRLIHVQGSRLLIT